MRANDDIMAEVKAIVGFDPSNADIGRELASRLRAGMLDADTIAAAALSLESLATLLERSQGVLAKALDARGRLPR